MAAGTYHRQAGRGGDVAGRPSNPWKSAALLVRAVAAQLHTPSAGRMGSTGHTAATTSDIRTGGGGAPGDCQGPLRCGQRVKTARVAGKLGRIGQQVNVSGGVK